VLQGVVVHLLMEMFVKELGFTQIVIQILLVKVPKTVRKRKLKNLRPAKLAIKPVVMNAVPEMKCARVLVVFKPDMTVLVPPAEVINMFGNVKVIILPNAKLKPVPIFPEQLVENHVAMPAIKSVPTAAVFP
jgi:hypothetical protein